MDFSKYHFLYNAAAHFEATDKYHPDSLMEAIARGGMEGFAATCWALELLSTQGELLRRDMGYDRQEPMTQAYAMLRLRPTEVLEAKRIVMEAIMKGIRTEDESEEVDEVLAEIQKKTETG